MVALEGLSLAQATLRDIPLDPVRYVLVVLGR